MDEILKKALEILKDRELYHGAEAHKATSHVVKQFELSTASAYYSAYWILYYAATENWECLKQFDYYKEA